MSIWDIRFSGSKKRPLTFDECLKAAGIAMDVAVEEGDSWITMRGSHILVGKNKEIKAGANGKFNGVSMKAFRRATKKELEKYEKQFSDIKTQTQKENDIPRVSPLNGEPTREKMATYTKQVDEKIQEQLSKYALKKDPKPLDAPMKEEDAIKQISGGDKTDGSCVSAAMAFIANQELGLDVKDFRGGISQLAMAFGDQEAISQVLASGYNPKTEGGGTITVNGYCDDYDRQNALSLLDSMQPGKNYVAVMGSHMSLVRKNKHGGIEYLELQHQYKEFNRWTELMRGSRKDWVNADPNDEERRREGGSRELQRRFGMTNAYYGPGYIAVVPADRYAQTDYMKQKLPYINTTEDKQQKGRLGHRR